VSLAAKTMVVRVDMFFTTFLSPRAWVLVRRFTHQHTTVVN
jgi:hypothetical protein